MSFIPNKNLGQHFLKNQEFSDYIAKVCLAQEAKLIIEIGCGKGQLTKSILAKLPENKRLHGIEIDSRATEILDELTMKSPSFSYEIANILEYKSDVRDVLICGNLPYNIGSKIITWCIENRVKNWVFLLQKEVAHKLAAITAAKNYSSLSAYVQALYMVTLGKIIPPQAFDPVPKVTSQLIIGQKKADIDSKIITKLSSILRSAFSCRRKMLKNTLCKSFIHLIPHVSVECRPQDLSPEEYLRLARLV